MTDPTRVLVVVDASEGDFYSLGARGASPWLILDDTSPDGLPRAGPLGVAYPDPRSWRLHRLASTQGGQDDLRISVQLVNDAEGEYASAAAGEAPHGQPEWFTARNRSTREADLSGRVALPSSQRRLLDSEDGRYALATAIPFVPLAGLAGERARAGAGGGTRTASGPADRARSPWIEERLSGLSPDAYREQLGILPEDPAREPPSGNGFVRVRRTAWGRRNRPSGVLVDDLGNAGSLASVLTVGRVPWLEEHEPPMWQGREGARLGQVAIRSNAPFAFSTVTAPLCLDVRDAARVTDNLDGRQPPTTGTSGGDLGGGRIELLDPAPDLPSKARPIKGRLHFDSSKVLRRAGETPLDPALQPPLGDPLNVVAGEIVPVVYVTAEDVGVQPPEIQQPPKKPPKKPPPLPPPGEEEEEEEEEEDEEDDGAEPEDGPGLPLFPEALQELIPDRFIIPTINQPPIKFGWDVGTGDIQTIPGTGGDPVEDGNPPISLPSGGTGVVVDDLQARDYGGPAIPCPNSVGGSQALGSDSSLFGPAPGFVGVEHNGDVLNAGGQTVELVPGGNPFDGQRSIMSVAVPPPGTPGGPATLGGWAQLMALQQRGVMAVLQGLAGGPGYLGANLAAIHRNTPGNAPQAHRLGTHWTAAAGQQLVINQPALQVTSVLEAEDGATVDADQGPGCAAFIRRARGSVRDERALLAGDGGGQAGDLLALHNQEPGSVGPGRDFHVDAGAAVGCAAVRALLANDGTDDEYPVQVVNRDPTTGGAIGNPVGGIRRDGTQAIQDLDETPDPPRDGAVLVYSVAGSVYQQTDDGTETLLGGGGGGGLPDPVTVVHGGTGSTTAAGARTNLGLGTIATLNAPLAIGSGGTASATAADARTALGLAIGSDVQGWDSLLDEFAALTPVNNQFVGFDGSGNLVVAGGGGGDVAGPGSSTDNAVVRWDGTAGTAIQNSTGWALGDTGVMAGQELTLTTKLASTQGGTGLNGVADSKTIYSNASNTYTTGTMADAFGEIHPQGSGAWVAQAGTWTSLGTTSRNFLGSPAAGTMGFQGFADFTRSAGGGSGTELAQFEQTSTAATSMVPLVLDAHPSGGNHSAAAGLSISAQRGGATVGTHQLVNAYGTNAYDYGLMQTASTTKFMALDTSENCARMNNSSGLNIVHESGSTKPTVAAGESRFYAFGSDGVPLVRSKVGTTTTDYRMWPEGAVADVGDPTGYTDIITQIVPWMVSLRDNFRASAFMA